MQVVKFNNNLSIPSIGFGSWNVNPEDIEKVITVALETGYRHFDCAYIYKNENEIGKVFKKTLEKFNLNRSDIFITSKNGYGDFPSGDNSIFCDSVCYKDTWRELEKLVDEGLVKSIGLSNFNKRQIDDILSVCRIKPVNLQVEIHANFPNTKLVDYAKSVGLTVTAYSPLGSPEAAPGRTNILTQPWVTSIAQKHGKTSAQILLRYLLQRDLIVVPKSVNPSRIKENFMIFDFELSDSEMEQLNSKGLNERQLSVTVFKHVPGYPFDDEY